MRAQASTDGMRRSVRHWSRALLRDAPKIFEIPPWPLGWILLGAFALVAGKSFVVAELGKLDPVIGIHGHALVPASLAEVASAERGVIRAVRVHEGQAVRRGDSLLEVAPPATAARIERLVRDRREASLDMLRLAAQRRGDPRALRAPPDADPVLVERARWKLANEMGSPLRAGTTFAARMQAEHAETAERIESIDGKLAQEYRTLRALRAPADGIVRGVDALAEGDAVEAFRTLLAILPADADLEIETRLTVRDMRWIIEGQRIALRFRPANAGGERQVDGEIAWVARDPIADPGLGWAYPVRIRVARPSPYDPETVPRRETPISGHIRLGPLSMIDWVTQSLLRERMFGAGKPPLAPVSGTR